jgi:hypothetical protein
MVVAHFHAHIRKEPAILSVAGDSLLYDCPLVEVVKAGFRCRSPWHYAPAPGSCLLVQAFGMALRVRVPESDPDDLDVSQSESRRASMVYAPVRAGL